MEKKLFDKIETFSPHVVVLDVLMPGTGGLQVLKKIKADHPEIQVILLTGLGTTQEGRELWSIRLPFEADTHRKVNREDRGSSASSCTVTKRLAPRTMRSSPQI